jgi:hypothetical protein
MIYVIVWLLASFLVALLFGAIAKRMGGPDEEQQPSEERFPRLLQTAQRGS